MGKTFEEYVKEREEQAQIILDTAVRRAKELGCGVVGDGTVHGDGIWLNQLQTRFIYRTQQND